MKKLKFLIFLFVSTVLMILFLTNSGVNADTDYTIADLINNDYGPELVYQHVYASLNDLVKYPGLYCLEHGYWNDYEVKRYTLNWCLEFNGMTCTNLKTGATRDDISNVILGQILSTGEMRYGYYIGGYTNTQKALYGYIEEWLDRVPPGETQTNRDFYGIAYHLAMDNDSMYNQTDFLNKIKAEVQSAYEQGRIDIYNGTKVKVYIMQYAGRAQQDILLAKVQKNIETQLVIKKVDSVTDKPIADVGFIVQNSQGQYLRQTYNPTTLHYVDSINEATHFKTDAQGTITITGLKADTYTITETVNPNSNYEHNIGLTEKVTVKDKTVNIFKIKNTFIEKETDITIEKVWNDKNNSYGVRPSSIKVILLRNGEEYKTATLTASNAIDNNTWSYTFKNLPLRDENENEYIYSVIEDPDSETLKLYFSQTIEEESNKKFKIINTYKREMIDIEVNKEWIELDSSNRPDSIRVYLLEDGSRVQSATLSESNGWKHIFENLPIMKKNIYINTYVYSSYYVQSITVKLYANGNYVDSKTMRSPWSCEFLAMPAYDSNGNLIEYSFDYDVNYRWGIDWDHGLVGGVDRNDFTMKEEEYRVNYDVEEVSVPGYNTSIKVNEDGTQYTIKNKQIIMGNVSISGKVWLDDSDGKGNNFDNKYTENTGDQTLEGIVVYWKDEDGNQIAKTTTNSDGYYIMREEIEIEDHTYDYDSAKYEFLNNSYVEFEYNGLKYTTVKQASSGDDTSKAIESVTSRTSLDNSFDEITNKGVIDEGRVLQTKYMNGNTADLEYDHNYSEKNSTLRQLNADFPVVADTKTVLRDLLSGYSETETDTSEYCTYEHWVSTEDGGYTCHHYGQRIDNWDIKDVNLGLVLREQPDVAITSDIYKVRLIMKDQEYTYYYNTRGVTSPSDELFDYKVKFSGKYTQEYRRPVNPADIAYINIHETEDFQVYVTYQITIKNQSTTLPIEVNEIVNYYDAKYDEQYANNISGWSTTSKYGNNYTDSTGQYKAIYSNQFDEIKLAPGYTTTISVEHKVSNDVVHSLLDQEDILLKNVFEIYSYTSYYGENTNCAEAKTAIQVAKPGTQYAGVDLDSAPGSVVMELLTGQDGKPYLNTDTFEDDTDMAPTFVLCKDPNYKLISGTVWEDKATDEKLDNNERIGNGFRDSNENVVEGAQVQLLRVKEDGSTELAYLYYINNQNQAVKEPAVVYTDAQGNYTFGSLSEKGVVVDNYVLRYTYGNTIDTYQDAEGNTYNPTLNTKINNPDGSAISGDQGNENNIINARNYKSTVITSNELKSIMTTTEQAGEDGERYKWHLPNTDGSTVDNYSTAVDALIDDDGGRIAIPSLTYGNFEDGVNVSAYTAPFKVQLEYGTTEQSATETQQQTTIIDLNGEQQTRVDVNGESYVGEGDITSGNLTSGTDYLNNWTVFDFGIIERPREDIIVDKTIENIKITLANGQVLTEGDPYGNNALDYIKALGDSTIGEGARDAAKNANAKFLFIEIDSELLQGARLDILYKITVTNNSEIDYEYEYDYTNIEASSRIVKDERAYYYYFGEAHTPLIKSTVEWLVDYVDPELTCTVGPGNTATEDVNGVNGATYEYQENEQEDPVVNRVVWLQVTPEVDASGNRTKTAAQRLVDGNLMIDAEETPDGNSDISAEQLISELAKNKLEAENYSIFVTNYFYDVERGESKSLNIFASKLLGNQADDYTYENHTEILQLNGKIARTIDSVNDGQQVNKWYRMGDYIPSLDRTGTVQSWLDYEERKHELDDDMITVRITPPTGLESNAIIYISVGAVALIVLGVGIFIIKKKILGR